MINLVIFHFGLCEVAGKHGENDVLKLAAVTVREVTCF